MYDLKEILINSLRLLNKFPSRRLFRAILHLFDYARGVKSLITESCLRLSKGSYVIAVTCIEYELWRLEELLGLSRD